MTAEASDIEISVVIPVFNEEEVLPELRARVAAVLEQLGKPWEVVFINDGSSDRSGPMIRRFIAEEPRFKLLELSRNFGHQMALTAGLARARGRAVIIMDGDLQDPPELIEALCHSWEQGNEVVLAVRRSRAERGWRRMAFDSFYRILRLMSDIDLSAKSGVFCLLDRAAVEPLKSMMEHNRYLPGLRRWVGFRQGVVFYDRDERRASHSKQGLARLTRYALDAIFSFSYKPLRVASYTGVLVWVLTGLYALLLVVTRLLQINVVPGFTTTVVAVLLIGGLQLLCLGVLGEYLARVYDEVKRRPLYIEREFIGSDPQPEPAEASKPRSSGR